MYQLTKTEVRPNLTVEFSTMANMKVSQAVLNRLELLITAKSVEKQVTLSSDGLTRTTVYTWPSRADVDAFRADQFLNDNNFFTNEIAYDSTNNIACTYVGADI
jgi:hypothetical protein